jgi:hypothetical protein
VVPVLENKKNCLFSQLLQVLYRGGGHSCRQSDAEFGKRHSASMHTIITISLHARALSLSLAKTHLRRLGGRQERVSEGFFLRIRVLQAPRLGERRNAPHDASMSESQHRGYMYEDMYVDTGEGGGHLRGSPRQAHTRTRTNTHTLGDTPCLSRRSLSLSLSFSLSESRRPGLSPSRPLRPVRTAGFS